MFWKESSYNVVSNAQGISTSATCMAAENDDVKKSDISTSKISAIAVFFIYDDVKSVTPKFNIAHFLTQGYSVCHILQVILWLFFAVQTLIGT